MEEILGPTSDNCPWGLLRKIALELSLSLNTMRPMRGAISGGSVQGVEAGAEALRAGGNAIDAAVAAAFAASCGEGAITSLAGGGAMIVRHGRTGQIEVCDFFASAPGLGGRRYDSSNLVTEASLPRLDFDVIDVDFGTTRQAFHIGRGAAAVPGAIPGLVAVWKRWGSLPLKTLVGGTIRNLREGVPLSAFQSLCAKLLGEILRRSECGRGFFDKMGAPLAAGSTFRNPALADTLETLIEGDPDDYYRLEIAPKIVEEFGESRGGWLTGEDLRNWEPVFRKPARAVYNGVEISTNPAPSVGGRFILRTLELLEAAEYRDTEAESPERLHRMVAALRVIADARAAESAVLDDPDCATKLEERLRRLLAADATPEPPVTSDGPEENANRLGNTVHISVVDDSGTAAAVTMSHGEGNGSEIGGTGILMNNFLGEADLFPDGFHRFTPGARLATMMAPTIAVSPAGDVSVLGSGGSNRIRSAISQVLSAVLDDGLGLEDAVRLPRVHCEGGVLSMETTKRSRRTLELACRLAERREFFDQQSLFFGGVNAVARYADGRLVAAADPRRDGKVRILDET